MTEPGIGWVATDRAGAGLVHVLECTRETVEALAARTRRSITLEHFVYREAELGAMHCTAEMSGDPVLESPGFIADLWSAYAQITRGEVDAGAEDLLRAARQLSDSATENGV